MALIYFFLRLNRLLPFLPWLGVEQKNTWKVKVGEGGEEKEDLPPFQTKKDCFRRRREREKERKRDRRELSRGKRKERRERKPRLLPGCN